MILSQEQFERLGNDEYIRGTILGIVYNPIHLVTNDIGGFDIEPISDNQNYPDEWFWKYVFKSGTRLACGKEDFSVMLSPTGWGANKQVIEARFRSSVKYKMLNGDWTECTWEDFCQMVDDDFKLITKNTQRYKKDLQSKLNALTAQIW